jgi:hypothetical protein
MSRSTFSGPVLSGDNRAGPFRNVGYATLTQNGYLNVANTTPNTAGYAGGSTFFVSGNNISNVFTPIYTPTTPPTLNPATQAIPADTASQIYRGFVCYLPPGCDIDTAIIDVAVVPTTSGTAPTTIKVYVSNNYTVEAGTPTYGTATITAVGRQAITLTGTNVTNANTTSTDFLVGPTSQGVSQIVFTLSIAGGTMGTIATGQIYVAIRYVQPDNNIGTVTAYPYGNTV